jgi:large subunit ribosomal protein L15
VKVHDLKPNEGAHKRAKRVGRGIGGKGGKTAGRGSKGQRARNNVRLGFEGGQLPLQQRLPKLRGFTNPFRVEYQAVNLDTIADAVSSDSGLTEITPEALFERGLIGKDVLVKVLGRGEVTSAVTVKAHAFSKSAEAAITAAGGTVERLPLPFSVRPPSSGNQHMNR